MKNDSFKKFCHVLAGIPFLYTSFKYFTLKYFYISVVLLLTAILFILFAALYDWMYKKMGSLTKLFFFVESIAIFLLAFLLFTTYKKAPAILLGIASALYFFIFLYYLYNRDVRSKRTKHKHRTHKKTHRGDSHKSIAPNI